MDGGGGSHKLSSIDPMQAWLSHTPNSIPIQWYTHKVQNYKYNTHCLYPPVYPKSVTILIVYTHQFILSQSPLIVIHCHLLFLYFIL